MYLLDTNVVSELRKASEGRAHASVVNWAVGTRSIDLFVSVITILELEQGILLVERRDATQAAKLRAWLEQQVLTAFADRTLPIDTPVARRCARLHVPNKRSERDALIAATALVHGMVLVTRNVADFDAPGLRVVNPWLA